MEEELFCVADVIDNYYGNKQKTFAITKEQEKYLGIEKRKGWVKKLKNIFFTKKQVDEFLSLSVVGKIIRTGVLATDQQAKTFKETGKQNKVLKKKVRKYNIREAVAKEIEARVGVLSKEQVLSKGFYKTQQWRTLRYHFLRDCDGRCVCCGASKDDGIMMHVDHIIPRTVDWEKALDFTNLQLLCEDCNIGKSNIFTDDWRGKKKEGKVHAKRVQNLYQQLLPDSNN